MEYKKSAIAMSHVLLLLVTAGTPGCKRDPAASGPTPQELSNKLATEFPAFVKVTGFEVQVSENIGDKVEPVFKSRFQGTIALTTDTFREARREGPAVFIKPAFPSGEHRQVFGVALSKLKAGAWDAVFQLDGDPITDLGLPRDLFKAERIVLVNSPDEEAFRQEQKRDLEKAEAQAREERERAEGAAKEQLESQERMAVAQREQAERVAQQQRAADEAMRRQELARLRAPIKASVEKRQPVICKTSALLGSEATLRVTFTAFDEGTGALAGLLESNGCVTKIDGNVSNNVLAFTETGFVRPEACTGRGTRAQRSQPTAIGGHWRITMEERAWKGQVENPSNTGAMGAFNTRVSCDIE